MGDLKVLNLQNAGMESLPSSLGLLKHLKVFYLNDCTRLEQLPPEIGYLDSLEVFDIRGFVGRQESNSGTWAPFPNIGHLKCLRRLLVSFNNFGSENFEGDVLRFCKAISIFSTTLEELIIDVNAHKIYCNWVINTVRDSVVSMTRLTSLKFMFQDSGVEEVIKVEGGKPLFYFPEAGGFASFLKLNSKSFEVYIGCSIPPRQTPELNEYQKYVKICNAQPRDSPPPNIRSMLSRCNAVELVIDGDLEHLSQFGRASLDGVQGCLIEDCNKIEAIADGNCIRDDSPMLPDLLELYIKKLPLLKSIWKGTWKAGSLVNLETLRIEECIGI